MDINTFEKSAHALKPYFDKCFSIGKNTANISPDETFSLLRNAGILAEKAIETTKKLLLDFPEPSKKQIEALDDAFIRQNLSPGGCADLLAITYFLYSLES